MKTMLVIFSFMSSLGLFLFYYVNSVFMCGPSEYTAFELQIMLLASTILMLFSGVIAILPAKKAVEVTDNKNTSASS